MFPRRLFPARYFAPRYFPQSQGETPIPPANFLLVKLIDQVFCVTKTTDETLDNS